jgi:hypothetical protein
MAVDRIRQRFCRRKSAFEHNRVFTNGYFSKVGKLTIAK